MEAWSIAVVDKSSSRLPTSELSRIVQALQRQVDRDFTPVWGVSARISVRARTSDVASLDWPLTIVDDMGGVGGVHLDQDGRPYAEVANGPDLTRAMSHELLEMLADPFGNRFVLAPTADAGSSHEVFYLVETCDPCETTGYEIDGVDVSNFVRPQFYTGTPSGPHVDFLGTLAGPLSVPRGCFLCWVDPLDGCWHQRLPDGSVVTATYVEATSPKEARDAAFADSTEPRHVKSDVCS